MFAESVARSRQVEAPPSGAAASLAVLHEPPATGAPPSRLVEPSGAVVPAGDPQQADWAAQKALASWEASAVVVPGTVVDELPEVHPARPDKSSVRNVALPLPQRRFRIGAHP
jgi:hypothetical protein